MQNTELNSAKFHNWWQETSEKSSVFENALVDIQRAAKRKKKKKCPADISDEIGQRIASNFRSSKEIITYFKHSSASTYDNPKYTQRTKEIIYPKLGKSIIELDNIQLLQEKFYNGFDGEPLLHFPEGLEIVKVKLPIGKIPYHICFSHLRAIGHQFVVCNPKVCKQKLNDYLVHLFACFVKKGKYVDLKYVLIKLEEISAKIIESQDETAVAKSKIKFLFNPDYELTDNEKKRLVNVINGNIKSNSYLKEIEQLIEKGGRTQKEMAKIIGISLSTFKRRLKVLEAK